MKPSEIQAVFAALLDTFKPITGQPADKDLTHLKSALLGAVVPITFDSELGTHNLMGLVLSNTNYKVQHNDTAFPAYLTRPGAYPKVAASATVGNQAEAKATHKVKVKDWKIFDCMQRKVRAFVIVNVEDTCVCEHHNPITAYSYVLPRKLMDHRWDLCTGLHSLDVLVLCDSMRTMHKNTEGILEYINVLEDAQKSSKHADTTNAFTYHDLLIIANAAMLSTQQYECTNKKWEDLKDKEK
eukprot:21416-Ditylum_brightwellii.AAC.1